MITENLMEEFKVGFSKSICYDKQKIPGRAKSKSEV